MSREHAEVNKTKQKQFVGPLNLLPGLTHMTVFSPYGCMCLSYDCICHNMSAFTIVIIVFGPNIIAFVPKCLSQISQKYDFKV